MYIICLRINYVNGEVYLKGNRRNILIPLDICIFSKCIFLINQKTSSLFTIIQFLFACLDFFFKIKVMLKLDKSLTVYNVLALLTDEMYLFFSSMVGSSVRLDRT